MCPLLSHHHFIPHHMQSHNLVVDYSVKLNPRGSPLTPFDAALRFDVELVACMLAGAVDSVPPMPDGRTSPRKEGHHTAEVVPGGGVGFVRVRRALA